MSKTKNCLSCNAEIKKSDKVCPNCGAKNKKPFYKKWWFYIIVFIFAFLMFGKTVSEEEEKAAKTANNSSLSSVSESSTENSETKKEIKEDNESKKNIQSKESQSVQKKNYERYGADELINDMENNPMRAEMKYSGKYVQIFGILEGMDSDGSYFWITGIDKKSKSIDCSIGDNQKIQDELLNYNIGDAIEVVGQITEVGEIRGYYLMLEGISDFGTDYD